jgi:exodeoxyribonuclease VII small subunit
MAKKSTKITITYSEAIKELEQILENLRSGKVEINDLTPTVKRANELVEECRRQLSLTRAELEKITSTTL